MVLTPHILIGALLAKLFPFNPWVILLIIASHYLLDMLPHWEYPEVLFSMKKALSKIFLDLLIGFGLVFVSVDFSWWIMLGIFFSILPDLPILLFCFFRNNRFLKFYFKFNSAIHFFHPSPVLIGILSQVIVVLISLSGLRYLK